MKIEGNDSLCGERLQHSHVVTYDHPLRGLGLAERQDTHGAFVLASRLYDVASEDVSCGLHVGWLARCVDAHAVKHTHTHTHTHTHE